MPNLLNQNQDFTEPDHRWSEGEQALLYGPAKDEQSRRARVFWYAQGVLGVPDERFEKVLEGEKGVETSWGDYLNTVKEGRSKAYEQDLLENRRTYPAKITGYMLGAMRGKPWPEGEAKILQIGSGHAVIDHATSLGKKDWPEAEVELLAKFDSLEEYKKNHEFYYLVFYAKKVKKEPWPELEKRLIAAGKNSRNLIWEYLRNFQERLPAFRKALDWLPRDD